MVRFRVAGGWRDDPALRAAIARGRAAPAHVVDAIAIEVDGVDLGAGRAEAELLPALEELVLAAARLVAGGHRASVHFGEGALELLLRRRGASALLTVVALERPSRVLARDVEVDLAAVARAARDAAEALLAELAALGTAPRAWGRTLEDALRRLAAARPARAGDAPLPPADAPPRRRARATVSCGFELRDDEGLLASYDGEGPDLGSLLAPGRVWIRAGDREALAVEGAPFLLLRDLVAFAGRIAAARRARAPAASAELALRGRSRLALAADLSAGTLAAGAAAPVRCEPLDLARALLEAAIDFCGAAAARNPRQLRNAYLQDLRDAAGEDLLHVGELAGGDRLGAAERPVRARRPALPRAPLAPGRMRHVAFRRSWEADVGAPAGAGLVAAGDLVVAAGAGAVTAFDAATGAARWSVEGASWAARAADALLVRRGDVLSAHDLSTGRLRWSRAAEPVSSVAPLRGGPFAVSAGGAVAALDPATGRVAWRFEPPAAHALHLAPFGPLALAAGDAGFLYGLDAAGRVAWRLHLPGPPVAPPQPVGEEGVVLCATDLGGAAVRFDAATGSRRYEAPLDFTPSGPAVPFAGLLAVCGVVGGDPVVAAVDAGGAIAWTDAAPLAESMAAGALPAGLLVKTAGGACVALGRDGSRAWTSARESPYPPPANLPPVAARRVVLVPGEQVVALDAATGATLGAAKVGAPVRLLVSGDLAIHAMDAEGLVVAARLGTHLSVV